jgi:GTP cyclohydrolase II
LYSKKKVLVFAPTPHYSEDTGGMYPELITRPDLKVFLPPIGGISFYIMGNPDFVSDPTKKLTLRVHDECNGSDVFGSDICTCRPYLIFGIEECVRTAQEGGVGLIVYFRKEGRALGEVTKYLVYNARKRAEGGDTAENYFLRTENIAGVKDMRFQATMPDVLHWLGIQKVDKMISMSNMVRELCVCHLINCLKFYVLVVRLFTSLTCKFSVHYRNTTPSFNLVSQLLNVSPSHPKCSHLTLKSKLTPRSHQDTLVTRSLPLTCHKQREELGTISTTNRSTLDVGCGDFISHCLFQLVNICFLLSSFLLH